MNSTSSPAARPNPFSSRYIRPGALAYVFPPGDSAAALVQRFFGSHGRGQIIGPHGSGKSTLLATLLAHFREIGRRPLLLSLHDSSRRLPRGWSTQVSRTSADIIIVDGYEQLGRLSRVRLRLDSRLHGRGLLVTAHRDVGFPTLIQTVATLENAEAIARQLLPAGDARITSGMIAEHFAASHGNVRETLFRLYDCYDRLEAGG